MRSETFIQCPKCKGYSGDDWSQCERDCPMTMSPHYEPLTHHAFGDPIEINQQETTP